MLDPRSCDASCELIQIKPSRLFVAMAFASLLAITLSTSAFAANPFRVQAGVGVQGGDPELEFAGVSGDLDTDTGIAISGGAWMDQVGWKHVSLGLEYLRLQDSDFSESGTILGDTVSGTIEPTIDAVMINAAIRNNSGNSHPYIGGGIGVGRVGVDATVSVAVIVDGETLLASGSAEDDDTAFAGQVFVGFDYDTDANWYVGINGRYFIMDANLFGADVEFRTWAVMGIIGLRF